MTNPYHYFAISHMSTWNPELPAVAKRSDDDDDVAGEVPTATESPVVRGTRQHQLQPLQLYSSSAFLPLLFFGWRMPLQPAALAKWPLLAHRACCRM